MIPKDNFGLKNFFYLIIALTATIAATGVAIYQVSTNSDWVSHTIEVKSDIRKLLGTLQNAETGQRGYIITLEEPYLAPYNEAKSSFAANMTELRNQIADNQQQVKRLNLVDSLSVLKFEELENAIAATSGGDRAIAVALVKQDRGKVIMGQIRLYIDEMIAEENNLLAERKLDYNFWRTGIFVLIGIAGLIMFFSLYRLFHQVQPMFLELEKTKETLRKTVINLSESMDGLKKTNQELRKEIEDDHPTLQSKLTRTSRRRK